MTCGALERWLNEGMPEAGSAAARAHAAVCPLCGPRLHAAEQVEALLASPAPGAPADFADGVLARIASEPALRTVPALPAPPPPRLPWWSWIGADPALPAALAAGSVLLGLIQAGFVLAELPLRVSLPAFDLDAIRTALDGSPLRAAMVTLALLPPVLLLSYALYQSIQGLVTPSIRRR